LPETIAESVGRDDEEWRRLVSSFPCESIHRQARNIAAGKDLVYAPGTVDDVGTADFLVRAYNRAAIEIEDGPNSVLVPSVTLDQLR